MAITLVNSDSHINVGGSSYPVNGSPAIGDYVVVMANAGLNIPATPSGYTVLFAAANHGGIFYKKVTSLPVDDVTFGVTTFIGHIALYRGLDPVDPFIASGDSYGTGDQTTGNIRLNCTWTASSGTQNKFLAFTNAASSSADPFLSASQPYFAFGSVNDYFDMYEYEILDDPIFDVRSHVSHFYNNNFPFDTAFEDFVNVVPTAPTTWNGYSLTVELVADTNNYAEVNKTLGNITSTSSAFTGYRANTSTTLSNITSNASSFVFTPPLKTISYVGGASGTNTATMPAHQAGDLIIVQAFRDGSTTLPTAVSGWTQISDGTGTTCCSRVAYKIAASGSEVVGTWTNATSVTVTIYRNAVGIGGFAAQSGTSGTITYPAITMQRTNGTSWVAAVAGHRSINVALETPPTGMTNRITVVDATDEAAAHDTNGGVSSWSSTGVTGGGTSSGWRTVVVELRAANASYGLVSSITGDITSSSTSGLSITANLSSTTNDIVVSSTSTITPLGPQGTLDKTLDNVTSSSTSTLVIKANSSMTVGNITSSSTSTIPLLANASNVLDGVTSSSTSQLLIKANSSTALSNITSSSVIALNPLTASLSATLDSITSFSESVISTKGVASGTLDGIGVSSTSQLVVSATVEKSLADVTSSSTVISETRGYADNTISMSLSATSITTITGNAANTLEGATLQTDAGTIITGISSNTLSSITVSTKALFRPFSSSEEPNRRPYRLSGEES
jgi:hypothetical protein